MVGVATTLGLVLITWRVQPKERLRYLDAAVLSLLGALLGSRMVFVGVSWGYYHAHLAEIYQVWKGGFSGIGALLGGILAVVIVANLWKIPLASLADALLPLTGILATAAWMGCWLDSCSYGTPSNAWWSLPGRDEWGVMANRVPVQLIGAVLSLLVVAAMDWFGRRLPAQGSSAAIGLFSLSAIIFALSYMRADPTPIWHGLRLEAWGALGLMVFSLISVVVLLVFRRDRTRRDQ